MRRLRPLPAASALALALAATTAPPAPAHAADCYPAHGLSTCVDSDPLWLVPGAGPLLSVAPARTTPAGELSFGFALAYLSRPVGLRVASPDPEGTVLYAVDDSVNASFLWALGLTDRFELTLATPVTLLQTGAGTADVLGGGPALPRSAVRDPRFGLAFAVLPAPAPGASGTALTTRLEFGVPLATPDAFAGGATLVAIPSLVLEHHRPRFGLAAQVGARLRGATSIADVSVGSQATGSLGGYYHALPRWLTVGAEAYALYTVDPGAPRGPATEPLESRAHVPAEWILSATSAPLLDGALGFTLGGGSAIPLTGDAAVTTPRFRFTLALRYAPRGAAPAPPPREDPP